MTAARARFVVWLAMLYSIVMYFVVMRLLAPPGPADNPALVAALTGIAALLVVVSFLVKGRFAVRNAGHLLALALCEAAALMGVVSWFLTASPRSYYPLAIGFAGTLMHWPSREA